MKYFLVGACFVLASLILYSQIPYPERKNKINISDNFNDNFNDNY